MNFTNDSLLCVNNPLSGDVGIDALILPKIFWPSTTNLTYAIFQKEAGDVWAGYTELLRQFAWQNLRATPMNAVRSVKNDTQIEEVVSELDRQLPFFSFTRVSQREPFDILVISIRNHGRLRNIHGMIFSIAEEFVRELKKLEKNLPKAEVLAAINLFIDERQERVLLIINEAFSFAPHVIRHEFLHACGLADPDSEISTCLGRPLPDELRVPLQSIMISDGYKLPNFQYEDFPIIGLQDLKALQYISARINNRTEHGRRSAERYTVQGTAENSASLNILLGMGSILILGFIALYIWRAVRSRKRHWASATLENCQNEYNRRLAVIHRERGRVPSAVMDTYQETGRLFSEYSKGEHNDHIIQKAMDEMETALQSNLRFL